MTCQKNVAAAQKTLAQSGGSCPPIDYTGQQQAEQEQAFLANCSQQPAELTTPQVKRLMTQLLGGYLTAKDLQEHFQLALPLPQLEKEIDQIYNQTYLANQPTTVFQDWLTKLAASK